MDNSEDAKNIARLVQGLAIYEKEPDAVNCTLDDYILDGGGKEPLFYCLLLDYYEKDSADASRHTCGMAFMYFGYVLSQGRFLYLEDLFLEEAYRKQGGGTLILQTLAEIGLHLDCSQFYWTALDWNSPALNLYEKVGAKIQKGLQISRYTGTSLRTFAESSII
jgi:GNAT superfamily N-acetyltransferase